MYNMQLYAATDIGH